MNEPDLVRKKSFTENVVKKQKMILVVAVIGIITLFAGSSYSLLTNFDSKTSNKVLTFQNSGLEMTVNKAGLISLNKMGPQSEDAGVLGAVPVVLTFTNTGHVNIAKYNVKLKDEKDTNIDTKYIRFAISYDYGVSYSDSSLLKDTNNIIYTDYNLDINKSKTIYLKIWLDENTPADMQTKNYYGDIEVSLEAIAEVPYANNVIKKTLGTSTGVVGINRDGMPASGNDIVREYRYSGLNVNNYVRYNNELWRIIGLFQENGEEYLKIVRDNNLESSKIPESFVFDGITYEMRDTNKLGNLYWNKSEMVTSNLLTDWKFSGLNNYLNNQKDTSKHPGYLSYLSNDATKMLRDTTYYYGKISDDTNLKTIYKDERVENSKEKVSLVSLSDFLYTFTKTNYQNESLKDYKNDSWFLESLKMAKNETCWLLNATDSETLYNIDETGTLSNNLPNKTLNGVRVVVSLNSKTIIGKGLGTAENPYILSI